MKHLLFLAAAAVQVLFIPVTDNKITFQYNFRKDEVIRTHVDINSQMGGQMNISMDTSMHVDAANPDGSAVLTTQMDSGNMKMGSIKIAMPGRGKKSTITVSKFGKRLETGNSKVSVVLQEFPDHAIGVGESWDGTMQMQSQRGSMDINAHFTLDSVKTVDGHKVAHLLVVEDGDVTKDMHVHATGWMDWDTQLGLATAGHIEGTQNMGKSQFAFTTDQTSKIDG